MSRFCYCQYFKPDFKKYDLFIQNADILEFWIVDLHFLIQKQKKNIAQFLFVVISFIKQYIKWNKAMQLTILCILKLNNPLYILKCCKYLSINNLKILIYWKVQE